MKATTITVGKSGAMIITMSMVIMATGMNTGAKAAVKDGAAYSTHSIEAIMAILLCPSCGTAMEERHVSGLGYECCPKCGGAWAEADAFEALLGAQATSQSRHEFRNATGASSSHRSDPEDGEIAGLGGAAHGYQRRHIRSSSVLGYLAAGALVVVMAIGAVGYFVVWPVLMRTVQLPPAKELVATSKSLGDKAGALVKPYAADAEKAARQRVDGAIREALGMPVKKSPAAEQGEGAKASGAASETGEVAQD